MLRVMNTRRVAWSLSGQAASSTGGWVRCCTNCTSTGPRQPATIEEALYPQQVRAAQRDQGFHRALEHRPCQWRLVGHDEAEMPSLCSASATKPDFLDGFGLPGVDQTVSDRCRPSPRLDRGARIEVVEHRRQLLDRLASARSDLEITSGRRGSPACAPPPTFSSVAKPVAASTIVEHDFDGEFAAERAIGGEGLQDRRRIGEAPGFDQRSGRTAASCRARARRPAGAA